MKLHIPTMLLTALLAVQATYTAKADVINSGHYYDTGKEMYSDMPTPYHDDNYCWATTGSNLVQYWQDTAEHLALANAQTTPPNGIEVKDGVSPYGTSYLKIYSDFLAHTYNTEETDRGEWQSQFLHWYFGGKTVVDATDEVTEITKGGGGFYTTNYEAGNISVKETPNAQMSLDTFTDFITKAIDNNPGGAVGLDVQRTTPTKGHAITCWGYELDADGNISSIIVTDSDDKYFGATRLNVVKGQNGNVALLYDNRIIKQDTPDQEVYFLGRDFQEDQNYVYRLTTITTKDDTAEYVSPETAIPEGGVVTKNTRLTNDTSVSGSVTVGDSNTVVVLTTDSGKKLMIDGNTAGKPALDITRGALVSVDSLEVKNSTDGGVVAVGNLHVGGSKATEDTASFTGNSTIGNGGAIRNESFIDISGNDTVVFTGNTANGKGGAIYSKGTDTEPKTYDNTTVSIRGNGEVLFSGNKAGQGGNDIYVEKGAFLNIADNDSVTFTPAEEHEGEAAIVNKGTTYLAAASNWDDIQQKIVFENCSLDSREGTVVIGEDINNQDSRTDDDVGWYGEVTFTDDEGSSLAISKAASSATLENVLLCSTGVYGNANDIAHSRVSNIWTEETSTGYTLQDLTLDTASHLAANGAITLSNVNIAFDEEDYKGDNAFDLSSLFQTSTFFNGPITFDASGLALPFVEAPDEMKVGLDSNLINLTELAKLTFLINDYEYGFKNMETGYLVFGDRHPVVPEPATSTLGLLALCALAARRRRK